MFNQILEFTLGIEGGYSNHKHDTGGKTMFGISDARDGRVDGMIDIDGDGKGDVAVRDLTLEDAKTIYERDYWQKYHCDALPDPVGDALFDFVVNSGGHGVKSLQLITNMINDGTPELVLDGQYGPKTHAAIEQAVASAGPIVVAGCLCFARAGYYVGLRAMNDDYESFIKGWGRRAVKLFALMDTEQP
ncbi:glycoside hydrolase family 108 protein [Desulfovibrio inopinatus]|uniref:glycoside hydrolase family 108 protein n=1 Tax=Desulfovibrio inopinatus TaxID=102109 RepID=UPI00040D7DE1|nr:glycosyl hydrolase 108 family protein [Desulfovibrio inopinatus]